VTAFAHAITRRAALGVLAGVFAPLQDTARKPTRSSPMAPAGAIILRQGAPQFMIIGGHKKPRVVSAGSIGLVPEWFVIVLVHSFVVRPVAPVPVRRSSELRSTLKLILRDVDAIAAKLRVVV
jgi:hypothetical protein